MSDKTEFEAQLAILRKELDRRHTARLMWLLNGLKDRLGKQVVEAVEAIVAQDVRQEWQEIAENEDSNTVEDFIRLLWEPLKDQDFEYTYEKTDEGYQMCVTRCPMAELAKELNVTDWMYKLTCATDPFTTAGFNPKIEFRRTKTMMEGADCCDHFYAFPKEQSE